MTEQCNSYIGDMSPYGLYHRERIIMKSLLRQSFHPTLRILKEKKIPLPIVQLIKTIDHIQHIVQLYQNEFINHRQVKYSL